VYRVRLSLPAPQPCLSDLCYGDVVAARYSKLDKPKQRYCIESFLTAYAARKVSPSALPAFYFSPAKLYFSDEFIMCHHNCGELNVFKPFLIEL